MADSRYDKLADVLINYSCELQAGENILLEVFDTPPAFTRSLVRAAAKAGGRPVVSLRNNAIMRDLILASTDEHMQLLGEIDAARMERMDAYVGVRGNPNISEWSDVPPEAMKRYQTLWWKTAHQHLRVEKTRWVVLRWPDPSMAQQAMMSTEAFEDFFFRVCTLDYDRMSRAMQPLKTLMDKTDRVRLVAPGTDLNFSIRDIPAVCCDGQRNIPDGEVYTAPVRDSVEGTIQFNAPTIYQGVSHENIRLVFKGGKIVEATGSNPEHLQAVLDTDEGARFIGEFAIGFNPYITQPMKDILFDEKIAGSIHFTPGSAYKSAWNGNESQIHWDMVLMMDPAAGGGEIIFDDVVIRRDGRFVLPELEGLNPENLIDSAES